MIVASSIRVAFAALALAPICLAQGAATSPPERAPIEVVERDGLRYRNDEGSHFRRNLLDLYLPAGEEEPPLLMFVHGGAWMGGNKDELGFIGQAFARAGIACAMINYRLSPLVQHPTHVDDCAAAVAWLLAHADEHGYDAERLFVSGHSAGAHLVALLALDPKYLAEHQVEAERIRGVLTLSGPFDVSPNHAMFRGVFGNDPKERRDASPVHHVRGGAPPFLVLWARREMAGLAPMSESLVTRLHRKKVRVESKEIGDRDHVSIVFRIGSPGDETTRRMIEFIRGIRSELDDETSRTRDGKRNK